MLTVCQGHTTLPSPVMDLFGGVWQTPTDQWDINNMAFQPVGQWLLNDVPRLS